MCIACFNQVDINDISFIGNEEKNYYHYYVYVYF